MDYELFRIFCKQKKGEELQMSKKIQTISVLWLIFILGFIISCAVNPVTGKRELMLISTKDEAALGKSTDKQVVEQYGIYDDPNLQGYLAEVGNKLAVNSHLPDLQYNFKVVDSEILNAFAVPGGYVYFTRGIMAHLNSEAEMAGVMGHEIGHITARHTAKQITRQQIAQFGIGVGSILSETFSKYSNLTGFGVGLLFLRFSRDNERQSDQLGVEYSTKSGYDALHMANFFHTLERMRTEDGSGIHSWMSTHHEPENRVVSVRNMAKEWQAKYPGTKFSTGRDAYLKKIDGIVYGPDPRQGFVENNNFYHPVLKFQFPVPFDWNVNNLPTQVQMTSKAQNAFILFSLAKQPDPGSAALDFIQNSKATVVENKPRTVNGMPARMLISDIISDQTNLRILSYFIQKSQQVYIFHGLSKKADFNKFADEFEKTMTNFNHVNDPKILNVKPERIRLHRVQKQGSLKMELTKLSISDDMQNKIALLNGMLLEDKLERGTLIKIVSKN